jgi:methionyl-tRNA formyltransferase
MKILILCTDSNHPIVPHLLRWQVDMRSSGHKVFLLYDKKDICRGDILFLVSCSQLIRSAERTKFRAVLVLHASDLPNGRGWSPHVWSIVNGASEITVCLLEADDPVDTGAIWMQKKIALEGHELLPEINEKLFEAEITLMTEAVKRFEQIKPLAQSGDPGSFLPKRTPENSRIDPNKTIAEQFDLLRVVDSERYPAFMDYRGKRYLIKIEKMEKDEKK